MKTFLTLWTLILALSLPHDYIKAVFYFFVAFLGLGLIAFVLALVVGFIAAWWNFRRRHGL